ncbi:MAG: exonuclease SbcCD subunit D C-terminal domain-containing protein, partial [Bacteroidales bacterium]|nr:exonuclease SbcCD subunit D C-terminal domain-containing protein [Bacteroidales bacterium]
ALGHIHKPMRIAGDCHRYSGTPLACSVSEAGQKKAILSVELGAKGQVEVKAIPLKPLREVRILRGTLEEVLAQGCGDYVTVCLTDKVDLDTIDMQDRLLDKFPNLLEIRRETVRSADYSQPDIVEENLAPFDLCCAFLKDLDDREKDLLRDVVNTVQEAR